MKKALLIFFILIFAVSYAQDWKNRPMNSAVENGFYSSGLYIFRYATPILDNILQYPGEVPGSSTFWDYQTNGASLRGFLKFGDTLVVAFPTVDSTDPTGATTRVIYYTFSDDNGTTWSTPVPVQSLPLRSGYPDAHRYYAAGLGTSCVISGRKYNSSGSRGGVWADALLGLGSFNTMNVPEPGRDYFGAFLGGNSYGGVYSAPDATNDSLFFIKYDVVANTMSGKTNLAAPTNGILTNVRYRMASNQAGTHLTAIWWDNTAAAYALRYRTSADGGTTWAPNQAFQIAFGLNGVINGDTCSPWFGMDVDYKPGTNQWGAVWSTLFPTATGQTGGYPQGCKILFASPTVNSGNPVEVAGKINMTIISDTNQFNNRSELQVGVTPVSHPSIAWSSDGSRITVVFSAFQPGDTLDGFTFNDIYVTYSDNGGTTWAPPANLTNTPTWDELYPVLTPTGNTVSQFHVKFQATRGPGCQSFSDAAPVYRVYHVLKSFNPANIGVKEISGKVPVKFALGQNYPNPFNPVTNIKFDVANASFVTMKVYDITGKEVTTLVNEYLNPGIKEVTFDASKLSTGIYFYTLLADGFRETKKMMLIK